MYTPQISISQSLLLCNECSKDTPIRLMKMFDLLSSVNLSLHPRTQWIMPIHNIHATFTLNLKLVICYLRTLQLHKVSSNIITILRIIHKKVKLLASIRTTSKHWSWDLNRWPAQLTITPWKVLAQLHTLDSSEWVCISLIHLKEP